MADGAQTPQTQEEPMIGPNEMLGIMQRLLVELNAYLNQAPGAVNTAVCQAYLERTWQWVQKVHAWQVEQQGAANDDKARLKKAS